MGRLRMMVGVATFGVLAAGATLLAQQGAGHERPTETAILFDEGVQGAFKVIYSVSNLVKWVPEDRDGHRPPVDMKPLIDLITSTVAPGTWKDRDVKGQVEEGRPGVGSIEQLDTNLSLIVVQTAEGHTQLGKRLNQLTRLMSAREKGMTPAGGTVQGPANAHEAVRMGQVSPEAVDRLFKEGTEAYKSADFARAVQRFEEGMRNWHKLIAFDGNSFDEYVTKKGIGLIVKRYVRAKDQLNEPIPTDSPFMGLLNVKFDEDGNVTMRAANPSLGGKGPQGQPTTATRYTGSMMGMMLDGKPGTLMGGGNQPMHSMTRMMGGGKPGDAPAPKGKEEMSAMMMPANPPNADGASEMMAQMMMNMGAKEAAGPANPPTAGSHPGSTMGMMGGYPAMMGRPGTPVNRWLTKPSAPGQAMASGMMGYGSLTGPNTETEQRLRAVEEKLDRLIKLLDTPKPDRGGSGLRR